jgi:hypothetical protein
MIEDVALRVAKECGGIYFTGEAAGEDARPFDFAQGRLPAAGTAALQRRHYDGALRRNVAAKI